MEEENDERTSAIRQPVSSQDPLEELHPHWRLVIQLPLERPTTSKAPEGGNPIEEVFEGGPAADPRGGAGGAGPSGGSDGGGPRGDAPPQGKYTAIVLDAPKAWYPNCVRECGVFLVPQV